MHHHLYQAPLTMCWNGLCPCLCPPPLALSSSRTEFYYSPSPLHYWAFICWMNQWTNELCYPVVFSDFGFLFFPVLFLILVKDWMWALRTGPEAVSLRVYVLHQPNQINKHMAEPQACRSYTWHASWHVAAPPQPPQLLPPESGCRPEAWLWIWEAPSPLQQPLPQPQQQQQDSKRTLLRFSYLEGIWNYSCLETPENQLAAPKTMRTHQRGGDPSTRERTEIWPPVPSWAFWLHCTHSNWTNCRAPYWLPPVTPRLSFWGGGPALPESPIKFSALSIVLTSEVFLYFPQMSKWLPYFHGPQVRNWRLIPDSFLLAPQPWHQALRNWPQSCFTNASSFHPRRAMVPVPVLLISVWIWTTTSYWSPCLTLLSVISSPFQAPISSSLNYWFDSVTPWPKDKNKNKKS